MIMMGLLVQFTLNYEWLIYQPNKEDVNLSWMIVDGIDKDDFIDNLCQDAAIQGIQLGRELERQRIIDSLSYKYYSTLKDAAASFKLGDGHRNYAKELDKFATFLGQSIIDIIGDKFKESGH